MTEQVAGIVLAGGLSRRMGGGDKGLRELGGKPLMAHTIERLSAQASPVAINANGDMARFSAFGLPVIPDLTADRPGPLAGVLAGMRWAETAAPATRFIVTAACDTPFFPEDLTARFLAAAGSTYPAIVLASSAGRTHPVFALWPVSLADDLEDALASGARKVGDWIDRHQHFIVEFPPAVLPGAPGDPFFNVNTPEDLAQAAAFIESNRSHAQEGSGNLRSAYFPAFKGSAKLLLWGDRMAIRQLSDVLRKGSLSSIHMDLHDICEAVDGKPIIVRSATRSFGMKPTSKGYEWGLDAQTFCNFADLVDVLATSEEPGHQYLECDTVGEVVVMVSCNEYPPDLRPHD